MRWNIRSNAHALGTLKITAISLFRKCILRPLPHPMKEEEDHSVHVTDGRRCCKNVPYSRVSWEHTPALGYGAQTASLFIFFYLLLLPGLSLQIPRPQQRGRKLGDNPTDGWPHGRHCSALSLNTRGMDSSKITQDLFCPFLEHAV